MEKWRIYIQEALCQIDFAKRAYKEFEQALLLGDAVTVFYSLHHFIVHATNVDKLLDLKNNPRRAKLLEGHVNLKDVDLKLIRKLRNHLEHFDERLDVWVGNHDGHAFFDMNIITGTKGFPNKIFLRALDGYTFKFYGEDFPLIPIFESIEKLNSQLLITLESG